MYIHVTVVNESFHTQTSRSSINKISNITIDEIKGLWHFRLLKISLRFRDCTIEVLDRDLSIIDSNVDILAGSTWLLS